jgi:hypothetical protein
MDVTVEKTVEGVAEAVIAEDEERRAQDLVRDYLRDCSLFTHTSLSSFPRLGPA